MNYTDEEGQNQLATLFANLHKQDWLEQDYQFISDLEYKGYRYRGLSKAQRDQVRTLYEKLVGLS